MILQFRRVVLVLLWCSVLSAPPAVADEKDSDLSARRQELIEIMKSVNFVPQLGKEDPFCKAFYEDFKMQKNIEHIQPIVRAEKYDDPALRPYQQKCPTLKMHKTMVFEPRDIELGGEPKDEADAESRAVGVYHGMGNFQLYRVDINNHPEDGDELMIYYEGVWDKKHDRKSPATRIYHVADLVNCKMLYGATVNQLGSAKWSRNGVIRYIGKNAIYELISADQREYSYFTLHVYSDKLNRSAPTCSYHKPH